MISGGFCSSCVKCSHVVQSQTRPTFRFLVGEMWLPLVIAHHFEEILFCGAVPSIEGKFRLVGDINPRTFPNSPIGRHKVTTVPFFYCIALMILDIIIFLSVTPLKRDVFSLYHGCLVSLLRSPAPGSQFCGSWLCSGYPGWGVPLRLLKFTVDLA